MTLRPYRLIVTTFITCLCIGYQTAILHLQTVNSELRNADAQKFYRELIDGLSSGKRQQVAELFRYPLQVRVLGLNSRLVAVRDETAMAQMYSLFLGPQFRCAIEQRPLVSDGVLSMAGGQVIAQRLNGIFRITRLTVSLEAPIRSAAPVHVVFPSHGKKQFGGRLAQNGVDTYIVSARAGQRLRVTLERFPGRALSIKVYKQRTADSLDGAAREYARVWSAPIPEDGNYIVEIQRRLPYCAPEVTYLMTVALQ